MQGFAALPAVELMGIILPDFCLIMCRYGEVDDGVDALEIDADHVVPLLFVIFSMGRSSGFQTPAFATRMSRRPSRAMVCSTSFDYRRAADIGFKRFHASAVLAGFLLDLERGVFAFDIVETTSAPAWAKSLTAAAPMPRDRR